MSTNPLFQVKDLNVSYGRVHVLQDVNLSMGIEPLGLVGRNGMGKTTLVNAIAGMLPAQSGSIEFEGIDIANKEPHQVCRAGIGYVPQGRRIFPSLTVDEHFTMVKTKREARWKKQDIYDLFPRLAERKKNGGGALSGGEQQMLAIGRALLTNPRLIVMDEPSEGLAPAVVDHLADVFRTLVGEGQAVLLVEQNLRFATELCDRILVMVNGQIAIDLTSAELVASPQTQSKYLGI